MQQNKCVIEGCGRPRAEALKKGLCMSCYSRAKKMIDAGKTTWNELENRGLCVTTEATDPFSVAFNKKEGE